MGLDKFSFSSASALIHVIDTTAQVLEEKNERIGDLFSKLGDSFRDEGYATYESEMRAADQSIINVISQLKSVAKSIAEYSEKIKDVV